MEFSVSSFFAAAEANASDISVFRIKQDYNFHNLTLHIFVEADDDYEFYRKSLEKIYIGYEVFKYAKKGKKNVLDSFDILDWTKYNKSRILFFVDKDYEDILGYSSKKSHNIFVTKFYSIENYLSSKEIFKYCLSKIFKINADIINEEILAKFDVAFNEFTSEIIKTTAIILIYRSNNEHIDLDGIKMDNFYVIKNFMFHKISYKREPICRSILRSNCAALIKQTVTPVKRLNLIKACAAKPELINFRDIRKYAIQLKALNDGGSFIRGKYHMWFFIKFMQNVRSQAHHINERIADYNFGKSENDVINTINLSIDINESNIFDILPMKIDTHNDVDEFLNLNLDKAND